MVPQWMRPGDQAAWGGWPHVICHRSTHGWHTSNAKLCMQTFPGQHDAANTQYRQAFEHTEYVYNLFVISGIDMSSIQVHFVLASSMFVLDAGHGRFN